MQTLPEKRVLWENAEHGKHAGTEVWHEGEVQVIACEMCGFNHIVPLPSAEVQKQFYEEDFYQSEKARYLEEAREDFEWKATECRLRLDVAEELLGIDHGRVLDIGSGPGDFLSVAQKRGWTVKGIEPSPVATQYAKERGLDVDCGFFSEAVSGEFTGYDFIHMSEVLEHVTNPVSLLKAAYSCLKVGGIICVSVPNDFSALQGIVKEKYEKNSWWVVPDHHVNYFDFDTLSSLLEETGFCVQEKLTNFPMELFLLMGQDYTKDGTLGRDCHGLRKELDISLGQYNGDAMKKLYRALASADMGRLAIVFAQKSEE